MFLHTSIELFICSSANFRTFDIGALTFKSTPLKTSITLCISETSELLIGDISTGINDSTSSG